MPHNQMETTGNETVDAEPCLETSVARAKTGLSTICRLFAAAQKSHAEVLETIRVKTKKKKSLEKELAELSARLSAEVDNVANLAKSMEDLAGPIKELDACLGKRRLSELET